MNTTICFWAQDHPLHEEYHNTSWGVPVHDDRVLFEYLILEGAQAGLNWLTILKKRDGYREVFDGFDPKIAANYTDTALEFKLQNPDIIRNRLKVFSVRKNAQAFLKIQTQHGSFSNFLWSFVDDKPIQNNFKKHTDIPASTEVSERISKALKKEGMTFVGPTIMYAYMQAIGMVNDHTTDCYRHQIVANMST